MMAAGIVLTIGIQAALNIGVVTVVLPTKGIPLPFISAGGTSMLLSSAAVGVLLSIAARGAQGDPSLIRRTRLGPSAFVHRRAGRNLVAKGRHVRFEARCPDRASLHSA
jgi:hypothetical protein